MEQRTISRSHTASYADPIRVAKGERVRLTGREELWDGDLWLWAVADDGKEGWMPDSLVATTSDGTFAAQNYSAIELTVSATETVDVLRETHGWAWCRNRSGSEGWVPLKNLSKP